MNSKQIPMLNSIRNISFKESFEQLSDEEKNYIYYLSKACWAGQPIVLFQTSYESPALFIIFQTFFSSFENFSDIKSDLLKKSITDVNYTGFIRYAAKFYSYFGNYTSGKKKFFPSIPLEEFEKILKISASYNDFSSIWEIIKYIIYDNSENVMNINLEEKNGKNCYYFGGIKEEQIKKIDEILKMKKKSLLNTRLFMLNPSKIVVLIGSIEEKQEVLNNLGNENNEIILLYGEYSSFLKQMKAYLEDAKKYTSKDHDKEIINDYINFFNTGDIEEHQKSQEKWVKENSSSIDFNFGWLETIFDPIGVRGLFEGFVGLADNFGSQKYEQFVKMIPQLISELPWDESFEKELNSIQFNSMEVICFARNGCPYGKCLPKYYNIKEKVGVKNILFFNACPSFNSKENDYFFIEDKDNELIYNFGKKSTQILTSIKQLMGYGSGKLFRVRKDPETNKEEANFNRELINPLTEKVIDKYYLNDESFEEKFTTIASVLNECRALLIGLYFCGNETIQDLFYVNKGDFKNVTYTIWILFFTETILGMNSFDEKNKYWVHPFMQARWIITKYILENQKEGEEIIKINLTDIDKETFKLQINKEMILCSANEVLSKLMLKMNIWKCTGDVESASECIKNYSQIDETFLKIKKIIDKNEEHNKFYLYHNLIRDEKDGAISYKEYQESLEGIVESNLDRYGTLFNKDVYAQWVKYATNFIKN